MGPSRRPSNTSRIPISWVTETATGSDWFRAVWAIRSLGDLRLKQAAGKPVKLTENVNRDIRAEAAWALGQIGDTQTLPALVKTLHDTDRRVRISAVEGVSAMGAGETVGDLQRLAAADPEEAVKKAAREGLEKIGR